MEKIKFSNVATISVVTSDRPANIRNLLAHLVDQAKALKTGIKILIIDSSLNSETKDATDWFSVNFPSIKIVYVHRITNGISRARNLAVKLTNSKYICFIDDDVIPDKNWLRSIMIYLKNNPTAEVIYGPVIPAINRDELRNKSERVNQIITFTPWVLTGSDIKNGKSNDVLTANSVIRTEIFSKVGLFNTVLGNKELMHYHYYGEDAEFFQRAGEFGIKFKYLKNMKVKHLISTNKLSLIYLFKRYFINGQDLVLFRFYSKYYVHSVKYLFKLNLAIIKETFIKSNESMKFGLIYFLATILGQIVANFALLLNYNYFSSTKKN